jgi:hypothetical protein
MCSSGYTVGATSLCGHIKFANARLNALVLDDVVLALFRRFVVVDFRICVRRRVDFFDVLRFAIFNAAEYVLKDTRNFERYVF